MPTSSRRHLSKSYPPSLRAPPKRILRRPNVLRHRTNRRTSHPLRSPDVICRETSTKASSQLLHHVGTVTESTCAMSPSRHVSSAAANRRIHIICGTSSRGRSAARPATNSLSRSAVCITGRFIAPATSKHGGRQLAWTRSRQHPSSGMIRRSPRVAFGPIRLHTWPIRLARP
jgi:hypothetical protein